MARVIVLDAGVLIAINDAGDAHHAAVERFLEANSDESLVAGGVTLAESLVHAAVEGVLGDLLEDYELLGIEPLDVPGAAAGTIARIRAETRLRMPDALVLYACEREQAELATTDVVLARAANARGIRTHLLAPG
jgi:predicted nucleic acid-binding protein